MRKLFLTLLLSGCAQSSNWSVQHIQTGNPVFDGAKLTYYAKESLHNIALEFHKTESGLKLFLVVHDHPIKAQEGNPKQAVVTTFYGGAKKEFTAYLFEGGQRLLASSELQDAVTQALKEGLPIQIKCSGYQTNVEPGAYAQNFAKMHAPPLLIPIEIGLE